MNRPLVVFTDQTDLDCRPGMDLLRDAGCDTLLADLPTEPLAERPLPAGAERAVALVVGYARIDDAVLDLMPRVRCIATMSAGTDMVDLEAARRRGVWVGNLVDAATEEVAVHALSLMLCLERRLIEGRETVAAGGWTEDLPVVPRGTAGLTLGLFGCGRIARRLGELARPLVARVVAHDPFVTTPPDGVELVDRETLLAQSDVLSLHLPLTPETAGTMDRAAFAALRPGAVLINPSRGELVDPEALREALDAGPLRAAALDVLHGEPPEAGDPLRRDPRVLVTPHMAFLSEESLRKYTLNPAENVRHWLRTGRLEEPVVTGEEGAPLLG